MSHARVLRDLKETSEEYLYNSLWLDSYSWRKMLMEFCLNATFLFLRLRFAI